jgi:hypothetical protein
MRLCGGRGGPLGARRYPETSGSTELVTILGMFFKVKKTDELFIPSLVADPDRGHLRSVTNPLMPDKEYMGHFYPGSFVGNSPWVDAPEINRIEWFKGDELEEARTDGVRVLLSAPK